MKITTLILILIYLATVEVVVGISCYKCHKQLAAKADYLHNYLVGTKPQCSALSSATQTEKDQLTTSCLTGCVKVNGTMVVDDIEIQIQIRDCFEPDELPLQQLADPALPIANYTCPSSSLVAITLGPGVSKFDFSMCRCDTDYCNFDPIYVTRILPIEDENEDNEDYA